MTTSTAIGTKDPATSASTAQQNSPRPRVTAAHLIPAVGLYQLLLGGLLIPLALSWIPGLPLAAIWGAMLVYDLVVLAIAVWDFRQTKQWAFSLQRHCEPRLSIGRDNPIHLVLTVNRSPIGPQSCQVKLRDLFPQDFRVDRTTLSLDLKPQTETELTYHVFPPRRGQFTWKGVALRQRSPLGLTWRAWRVMLETTAEVYPDLIGLRLLSVRLSLESTGNMRRRRLSLGGTEFSELREYNRGDDVRLIDWKATARRGHPLVRLLEPERDQPLIILLDRGRLMTASVAGLKRFDWALNATLALSLAGLRRGDRVGVCVFDNDIHTWIGPRPGQSHLSQILAKLYNLEPVMTESDYAAVVSQVLSRYTRRALVVLLTDIVDAIASSELLAAMARLTPRFLPFCVALRDPQVDIQAHQPLAVTREPADIQVQGFYDQAVALDLIHQRTIAFARIKQQGVLVLDAPANKISEQLVDRYLLLKARNRL